MKKTHKTFIKIFAGIVILFIVGFIAAYTYIKIHKEELIKKASLKISEKLQANVKIKDLGLSWFATFPYFTLQLEGISVTDTTYGKPVLPFLEAESLYINFDLFQLIKGNAHINRMELSNGDINFRIDSLNRSNLHILDTPQKPEKKQKHIDQTLFNFLTLNNIKVFFSDSCRNKKYDILIKHIQCIANLEDTVSCYHIDMDLHVNYLGLNLLDGTYGRNKELTGDYRLYMNPKKQTLALRNITLNLDNEPVIADGVFHLDTAKHFNLHLSAPSFSYQNAATTMLEKTQPLLSLFKVARPMDFEIYLYGNTKYLSIPHVKLIWKDSVNDINTPAGEFTKCSMTGVFINDVDTTLARRDENSSVTIHNFSGYWKEGNHVFARAISVTDLIHPFVKAKIQAKCNLRDIDSIINSDDFTLEAGEAKVNMEYEGTLNDSDRLAPDINGTIELNGAELMYAPRNMRLKNCDASIKFHHHSFQIAKLSGKLGKSSIDITGAVNDFAPIFTHSNETMTLKCRFHSSLIDLNELIPLVSKRTEGHPSPKAQRKILASIGNSMDAFTNLCDVNAAFSINRITYKHFEGDNLDASVTVNDIKGWQINRLTMDQGNGKLTIGGAVTDGNDNKHLVSIATTLTDVDVPGIFYDFDDFGLQSLSHTNLKGQANMKGTLTLALNDQGAILPGSINGTLDFQVKNGALLNFRPIEDIGEKIFPKRNFSDVEFAELKDNVSIANNIIKMDRMEIASPVIHLYVEGSYDLKGPGTDLTIQVPMSNISKRYDEKESENNGVNAKTGPSVYVHAVQDDDKGIVFKYSLSDKTKAEKPEKHKEHRKRKLRIRKKK